MIMDWTALLLSLRLAAVTTICLVALGVPLALWLARTRWRGRIAVEACVSLPLVLPPTVLGFYLLLAFGPQHFLGRALESIFGVRLPFTFGGLVVASVIYSLPFAVQPFTAAFRAMDWRLVEAASCLGAGGWRAFRRVTLPLIWPGLLAGIVLSFGHTLGEFGVVLMIGGNLPGVTRTASVSIYDAVQSLDYALAGRTAAALLVFAFLLLIATYSLQHRAGHRDSRA